MPEVRSVYRLWESPQGGNEEGGPGWGGGGPFFLGATAGEPDAEPVRELPPIPWFPSPELADADGLLRLGGRLDVDWLLAAYRRGIFPWPFVHRGREILAWFSPDPRAVLELDRLHVSRRLRRTIRSGRFEVTADRAFPAVIDACAGPRRGDPGTWITRDLRDAYVELHAAGHAHSVETWRDGELVGGVYGVSLGGSFSGESMFHREPDASKVALAALVAHLRARGFTLFDVQQETAHSVRMGATTMPRPAFLRRLHAAVDRRVEFGGALAGDILTA